MSVIYQMVIANLDDTTDVPGRVLDVPGGNTAPFTPIIIYQPNGGDNQLWNFEPVLDDPGFFWIGNKKSQLLLTAPTNPGGQVFQLGNNASDLQMWQFVPANDVLRRANYIVNKHTGLVLDIKGDTIENGTPVIQYQLNHGKNQQWYGGPR